MIQQGTALNTEVNHFGFNSNFNKNKVFVGFIYKDTEASKVLELGDQVLEINTIDFTNITTKNKCTFFNNGIIPKEADQIVIKVARDGKELEFELKKARLL